MNNEVHYTDPSRQSKLPDLDEEQASTSDYVRSLQPIKDQKKRAKRNWIIALVVLLLLAASAATYVFVYSPDSEQAPVSTATEPAEKKVAPENKEAKTYTSEELNISFDYPGNWTVDDATQGIVLVSSPVVELKDIGGQEIDGIAVAKFMNSGSEVPVFEGVDSMIATLDSNRITYDAPTQNQREQTFLSFAGMTVSGLDAVFITGNSGYQKNQAIPESDIKRVEPIISVTFYECPDGNCEKLDASSRVSLQPTEWEQNETLRIAQKLLQSLKVM